MNRKIWVICLAVWLLCWGLLALTNLHFQMESFLLGVLAVAAGVLALLDR